MECHWVGGRLNRMRPASATTAEPIKEACDVQRSGELRFSQIRHAIAAALDAYGGTPARDIGQAAAAVLQGQFASRMRWMAAADRSVLATNPLAGLSSIRSA